MAFECVCRAACWCHPCVVSQVRKRRGAQGQAAGEGPACLTGKPSVCPARRGQLGLAGSGAGDLLGEARPRQVILCPLSCLPGHPLLFLNRRYGGVVYMPSNPSMAHAQRVNFSERVAPCGRHHSAVWSLPSAPGGFLGLLAVPTPVAALGDARGLCALTAAGIGTHGTVHLPSCPWLPALSVFLRRWPPPTFRGVLCVSRLPYPAGDGVTRNVPCGGWGGAGVGWGGGAPEPCLVLSAFCPGSWRLLPPRQPALAVPASSVLAAGTR